MTMAEKKALQTTLAAQGFPVQVNAWPRKITYYKPDGEAMPNMPADPGSMERYLRRGFTVTPPVAAVAQGMAVLVEVPETEKAVVEQKPLVCICGFNAKSAFGLMAHQRKHGKEKH